LLKIARETKGENVTVVTSCVCVHGWHNCTCKDSGICTIELDSEDEGYIPPWSQEIPKNAKVTVFEKSSD